jgi:hypothetical protein
MSAAMIVALPLKISSANGSPTPTSDDVDLFRSDETRYRSYAILAESSQDQTQAPGSP